MPKKLARMVVGEAVAYAKTGMLAGARANIRGDRTARSGFGVVFVHGVAANSTQFRSIQKAMAPEVEWFDAFEYRWIKPLPTIAQELRQHLDEAALRCERLLVVGHSLGGLLLRMVLQEERPVAGIEGFISICAPLHGTTRSRFAPLPQLRSLAPDSDLIARLHRERDRLDRYRERILTIGTKRDQFVAPHDSAHLDGHEQLRLEHVGHVAALFDDDVHRTIRDFTVRIRERARENSGDD